jgi:hypothetical protein
MEYVIVGHDSFIPLSRDRKNLSEEVLATASNVNSETCTTKIAHFGCISRPRVIAKSAWKPFRGLEA